MCWGEDGEFGFVSVVFFKLILEVGSDGKDKFVFWEK